LLIKISLDFAVFSSNFDSVFIFNLNTYLCLYFVHFIFKLLILKYRYVYNVRYTLAVVVGLRVVETVVVMDVSRSQ
jgi:hypothetical protein